MEAKIQKLSKSKIELEIEVPTKEFDQFIEEAALNLSQNLDIPGFRKGKIPKEIIQKEVGLEKILREAAELAIRENYLKAISENKIEVLGRAEIVILKLAPNNPLKFKAIVSVLPEIKLPDYKKITSEIKRKKISISENEIRDTLSLIQKSRAKFVQKNSPAQKGDFVEFEYSSTQIENGQKLKDNFILGEGHLIPGFEENLEGMKSGEEKNFEIIFPKNHFQKNISGGKAAFQVKMISVQKVEISELSDEFAKSLGNFENLTTLRNSVSEGIKKEKDLAESQRLREEILKKITEKTEIDIPEVLIEEQKKKCLEELKQRVWMGLKMNFENYLKEIKKTEKEMLDSFYDVAKNQLANSLILKEIQKKERIEVSEKEIKEKTNEILRQYPDLTKLDVEDLKDYSREIIENEKILQFLESFTT